MTRRPVPGESVPAQRTVGLQAVDWGNGPTTLAIDVAPWMHDHRGAPAPGLLAVLTDGALGYSAVSSTPETTSMATTHLHLEFPGPIPAGTERVVARARARARTASSCLAEGTVSSGDSAIAFATLRALYLPFVPADDQDPDTAPLADEFDPAHRASDHRLTPSHVALGLHVVAEGDRRVDMAFAARPRFANRSGGLHGGFGCFAGERTLDLALRAAAPEHGLHLVELRAVFTRPVAADGAEIRTWAEVEHLGRRLASVHGEVLDHRGRPAVVVDGTFAI